MKIRAQIFYIFYVLDLLLNVILRGYPHETVSSRCYRLHYIRGDASAWAVAEKIVNALAYPFDGPDHCKQSYENIVNGVYLPAMFMMIDEAKVMNAAFDRSKA